MAGLSREHSTEDKWANRALTAEMEVGRLTVRLGKNIAGWASEQRSRKLAERKLERAMDLLRKLRANPQVAFYISNQITTRFNEISAMDNDKTESDAALLPQKEMDSFQAALREPAKPESPEPSNQEPEPDHEAARKDAERIVAAVKTYEKDGGIHYRIADRDYNLARAYLAQADELATLKGKIRIVPHYATGSGNPRHVTKDSPLHVASICRMHQGRCKYEEIPNA